MTLGDVTVVLCRPAEAGNVGGVCRAMKNMGLGRLRLVAPEKELDDAVVRSRAVHAADVWERAEFFGDLPSALADQPFAVGTTRRRGRKRKDWSMTPEELAEQAKARPGGMALVFGNERTGLDEAEIACCHIAAHIPADEAFPSLNLSHAVQVFAYALFRSLAPAGSDRPLAGPDRHGAGPAASPAERKRDPDLPPPLTGAEIDVLVRSISDRLAGFGFYKQPGREAQERFFRDLAARAALRLDEARYLASVFRKLERLAGPIDPEVSPSLANPPEPEHT